MSVFKPEQEDNLVARAERVANNVFDRFESVIARLENTVPRQMGAEKVPGDEEVHEYLLTVAQSPDPAEAGRNLIEGWAKVHGRPKAQKMFVSYVDRNEKRIQRLVAREGGSNSDASKSLESSRGGHQTSPPLYRGE